MATPLLENATVPETVWLGGNAQLSVVCTETIPNTTIDTVIASIDGPPGVELPDQEFTLQLGKYKLTVPAAYLTKTGHYDVTISCTNSLDENISMQDSFAVSELTLAVTVPGTVYDDATSLIIAANLKKDGIDQTLSSGNISFTVTENGVNKTLLVPPYTIDGWFQLIVGTPLAGTHSYGIVGHLDTGSVSVTTPVTVSPVIDLSVLSLDKNIVKTGDLVTVTVKSFEKGQALVLDATNIVVHVAGQQAVLSELSSSTGITTFKAKIPSVSAGSNIDFKTTITYGSASKVDTRKISVTIPISGEFLDKNGGALAATIGFVGTTGSFSFTSASDGTYTGTLPPGTYDITVSLPEVVITLDDASFSEFDDPINVQWRTGIPIEGFATDVLVAFEADITFNTAEIVLDYHENVIPDEDEITVYRCSEWNFGKEECNGDWSEIQADIDKVKNELSFTTNKETAFIVAFPVSLTPTVTSDKTTYSIKDVVRINGVVTTSEKGSPKQVAGVTVTGTLGTTTLPTTTTDKDGVLSIEAASPTIEGTYTVTLYFTKEPYLSATETFTITVVKKQKLSVLAPESVKIEQGKELGIEFLVLNNGETDLADIELALEGVPAEYYSLSQTALSSLVVGDQQAVIVTFTVPENASKSTYSATFRATSGLIKSEQSFGFTVLSAAEVVENAISPEAPPESVHQPSFGLFSGNFLVAPVGSETALLVIIAVGSFTLASLFRRRRAGKESPEMQNLLIGLRQKVESESLPKKRTKRLVTRRTKRRVTRRTRR
ncbi:MAG: hypothetical protein KKA90_05045 [Nanoarchaeota archaeon]|nr:hypothetical protein [Nanoarchaeota archaeon]